MNSLERPIALPPTHAYSPASIGKGYLRAMGIEPILNPQASFPKKYVGYAQAAFLGGRTSVHIRKVVCPVVHTDFLSTYSMVNSLMCQWRFVIAREIRVVEHCKKKLEAYLRTLTPDALFKPETWKQMTGFVKGVPNGDILPMRSKFQPGKQRLTDGDKSWLRQQRRQPMVFNPGCCCFSASHRRVPEIIDGFLLKPCGKLPRLTPTKLWGIVKVGPRRKDFFSVTVEERLRLA